MYKIFSLCMINQLGSASVNFVLQLKFILIGLHDCYQHLTFLFEGTEIAQT